MAKNQMAKCPCAMPMKMATTLALGLGLAKAPPQCSRNTWRLTSNAAIRSKAVIPGDLHRTASLTGRVVSLVGGGFGEGCSYQYKRMMTATPEQLEICKRFASEACVPASDEKLGIALHTLSLVPLHAVRLRIENGTCGWYVWGGEHSSDEDFYKPIHVHHLASICPRILPYLALPSGWRVMLATGHEDVWFDECVAR